MGYKTAEIRVTAYLSSHNDERDALDRDAWRKLVGRIQQLADTPEFADLRILVSEQGEA